jgi:hypothetical protein
MNTIGVIYVLKDPKTNMGGKGIVGIKMRNYEGMKNRMNRHKKFEKVLNSSLVITNESDGHQMIFDNAKKVAEFFNVDEQVIVRSLKYQKRKIEYTFSVRPLEYAI